MSFIVKIKVNSKGLLYIKSQNDYKMIYRSAMGVQWDENDKSLYCNIPIKEESDIVKNMQRIISAVDMEYGIVLKVNSDTQYENISENIKITISKLFK